MTGIIARHARSQYTGLKRVEKADAFLGKLEDKKAYAFCLCRISRARHINGEKMDCPITAIPPGSACKESALRINSHP